MQNNQSDMQKRRIGKVTRQDLHLEAAKAGDDYRLQAQSQQPLKGDSTQKPILNGQLSVQGSRQARATDIQIHTTHAAPEIDASAQIMLPAGLVFGFIAAGTVDFGLAQNDYRLTVEEHTAAMPGLKPEKTEGDPVPALPCGEPDGSGLCFMFFLARPTVLYRGLIKGQAVKKLNLTVTPDWFLPMNNTNVQALDLNRCLQAMPFEMPHAQVVSWQPGARLSHNCHALLQQMLVPFKAAIKSKPLANTGRALQDISQQGLANYCLAQALQEAEGEFAQRRNAPSLAPYPVYRCHIEGVQLKALLAPFCVFQPVVGEAYDMRAPSVALIANAMGVSVSALQRLAKRTLGCSVIHYIRQQKLQAARKALAAGELSIGEAAYFAGYNHVSNFAIAFKKAFGFAPGVLLASC